jgi:RimJ/RimL family protein N-acetyltransferase
MAVTVEPLGAPHVAALKALLTKDTVHNLYLLGLMEEFGVVCGPNRAPFVFYGRFADGELTAALFVGGSGGLVVPSASPAAHLSDITRALAGKVTMKSCLGEKALVDALCRDFAVTPKVSRLQKLFFVSADDLGPFTNPLLRVATEKDLEQLVPMAADCVKELFERDPLAEDPEGFPVRVRQRVRAGRTYVLEEAGKLVFKLDVGSRSQFGAELEGLYTVPAARGRGHALHCLGQISRFLLSSLPRLTVRVDDANPAFANIARKVGYLAGRAQRLVWAP